VFSEGCILYFTPFYFKNGNTAKPKYFIVLRNIDNNIILASLPTRTNTLPNFLQAQHGCINDDASCVSCYMFSKGKVICDNSFCFSLDTFIYGQQVDYYELSMLEANYPIENIDYEIIGVLLRPEYEAIVDCLKGSSSVKNKIKRYLNS